MASEDNFSSVVVGIAATLTAMRAILQTWLPSIGQERGRWEDGLWLVFLIWSAIGLFVVSFDLRPATLDEWAWQGWLVTFIRGCLVWGDFVSNLLAAAVVTATALRHLGKRATWISAAVIMVGSGIVETVGSLTGFPFGAYSYTGLMGPQLGPLPIAIPLAWWVVVAGGYLTMHMIFREAGRWRLSLYTATLALVFDWILEPFAWQVRGYWVWHDGAVPMANYLTWWVLSFVFARSLPLHRDFRPPHDARPAGVLLLMTLMFIVGRLAA